MTADETAYTPPSDCELCVPHVTYTGWGITEYAHEDECPNRPRRNRP